MKKFLCLIFFLFIDLFYIFGKAYSVKIKKVDFSSDEKTQYAIIELDYVIKNNKDILFVYDIQNGNDNHYEENYFENKICIKKIYVFKPTEDSWYGWGYNPNYPIFIQLKKGEKKRGKLKLSFEIPLNVNPYEIQYQFNFITADCDITKYINSFSTEEINNDMIENVIIRFNLKKKILGKK